MGIDKFLVKRMIEKQNSKLHLDNVTISQGVELSLFDFMENGRLAVPLPHNVPRELQEASPLYKKLSMFLGLHLAIPDEQYGDLLDDQDFYSKCVEGEIGYYNVFSVDSDELLGGKATTLFGEYVELVNKEYGELIELVKTSEDTIHNETTESTFIIVENESVYGVYVQETGEMHGFAREGVKPTEYEATKFLLKLILGVSDYVTVRNKSRDLSVSSTVGVDIANNEYKVAIPSKILGLTAKMLEGYIDDSELPRLRMTLMTSNIESHVDLGSTLVAVMDYKHANEEAILDAIYVTENHYHKLYLSDFILSTRLNNVHLDRLTNQVMVNSRKPMSDVTCLDRDHLFTAVRDAVSSYKSTKECERPMLLARMKDRCKLMADNYKGGKDIQTTLFEDNLYVAAMTPGASLNTCFTFYEMYVLGVLLSRQ